MKKNLLSVVLALLMAAVASAETAFVASETEVIAGQVIAIALYTDVPAGSMTLVSVVETPGVGGTARDPWLHPYGWDLAIFPQLNVVNAGGLLIENVIVKTPFGSPPITGLVFGFDYTVPQLDVSTRWTIGPGEGTNNVGGIRPGAVELHIIPEPMTIVMLGLGGLLLRRSRK